MKRATFIEPGICRPACFTDEGMALDYSTHYADPASRFGGGKRCILPYPD